ncbi:hypothetical protein E2C01_053961 [Portunus trituberculatus]|uniref:Uncharacterized protein n=1 Tax=Portunus trituberculatus TaxID=210409 RepID=A0A5B7GQS7_PORTR|nr:hypothetical protein [Portunus trituberculatus]
MEPLVHLVTVKQCTGGSKTLVFISCILTIPHGTRSDSSNCQRNRFLEYLSYRFLPTSSDNPLQSWLGKVTPAASGPLGINHSCPLLCGISVLQVQIMTCYYNYDKSRHFYTIT